MCVSVIARYRCPSILALLFTPLSALAGVEADASSALAQAQTLDTVKVTSPLLSSQAQSIAVQRMAVNVVSAIAADDIGQLPDQTAAAALARLPAVAVQRDQGQERFIQIRGAPARWTSVAFDGLNVIGAEDRIFRFDAVPASVIETVAIHKTLTAAMPAEALAGRVNIETLSPMSVRGWHGLLEGGYGAMALGGGGQHQGSARLAWSNARFGALLGGSVYSREQITDNREFRYDDNGLSKFDLRSYHLTRETNSGLVKLEWRPADGHALTLSSLYTEFKDHERRDQYVLDVDQALQGRPVGDQGTLLGVPYHSLLQDGRYSDSTWTSTVSGQHALDVWDFAWALNRTHTEDRTALPLVQQNMTRPAAALTLDYDHRQRGLPTFTLYQTVADGFGGWQRGARLAALPQQGFDNTWIMPLNLSTKTRSTTLAFNAIRHLDRWSDARLHLGVQGDRRRADGVTGGAGLIDAGALAAAHGLQFDLDPHVGTRGWDSGFPRGFDVNYLDNAAIGRDVARFLGELEARGLYTAKPQDRDRFSVQETITAAYAMLEARAGAQQWLGGVRLEHARIDSHGFIAAAGEALPRSQHRARTDVFPSLHWNLDLSDSLKLRAAAISGLARPSFGQLRVNAEIDDSQRRVSGGNPGLLPERAVGVDAALEWYFAEAAIASAGVFYRKVTDVLFDSLTQVSDARYDSGGISRMGYAYNTTLNGGGGRIAGAEFNLQTPLAFLPARWDGFGVQMNLALVDSTFTTPEGRTATFPGTSKAMFNTSLYWDKHGLSARVSWQWRARWLDAVGAVAGDDLWWHAAQQLDVSVRYALNDHLTLFMDANNLTDATGLRYLGSTDRPYEREQFGRRYMAGVRLRF